MAKAERVGDEFSIELVVKKPVAAAPSEPEPVVTEVAPVEPEPEPEVVAVVAATSGCRDSYSEPAPVHVELQRPSCTPSQCRILP